MAWANSSDPATRSFRRYARPAEPVQKGQGVRGGRVLAEDHDADFRAMLTKPRGSLYAFICACGGHPNVGDDDVWFFLLNQIQQFG
jgi:hypothetical protein